MPGRVFLDSNILIYALVRDDSRTARAENLLTTGGIISVQVLNEFSAVARRKLKMSWGEVLEALNAIRVLCPSPVSITIATHELALRIAQRHGYGIYDALVAASAIESRCEVLYSEDMQDGQVIDGR